MTKRHWLSIALVMLGTACCWAQNARTIQVDIAYQGSGKVDASHKIYAALWDSADFNAGPPVAVKSVDSKNGSVTFADVQTVPAYVTTAYDPTGSWDAQSPPPSGTSLGMYTVNPPKPEPIDVAPGKTAKVKRTFDDSNKVP